MTGSHAGIIRASMRMPVIVSTGGNRIPRNRRTQNFARLEVRHMDAVIGVIKSINNFVWGPVMLVLLVGTGLYLNVILRFFSFRNWITAYKCLWAGRQHQSDKGEISPWNALMTALAGDIGTGNIVGVATAIAIGGPGALFWMWVTALVGMMTKFAEIILAVKYREKTAAGNWVGGAMYFIKNGLGQRWVWLGTAFAIFGFIASFGIGNLVQVNAIAVSLKETFSIPTWGTGLVLFACVALILLGGVQRIGSVAGRLVPLMAAMYVLASLVVIFMNVTEIPRVFWWVISEAFTPTAATGGFTGSTVLLTIRMGVARGIFSNEAGLGSTPMVHATATASSPLQQATLGMLDVFIDTIIVCSMTGFVILITGTWSEGPAMAGLLTHHAFELAFPHLGGIIVTCSLSLFAFTTVLGWAVYGERCVIYLFGDSAVKYFRICFCLAAGAGSVLALDLVWLVADTANALMAFPNLIGILLMSPKIITIIREEIIKDPRFVF